MKASAISLLVFLFASLGSSLSIRGPPPGRAQDDKDLAAGKPKWPSETPPPVDDVTFSWCHSYNNTESCFSRDLKHGWCYDLRPLDEKMLDLLEDVGASGGQCMLFSGSDCKDYHTATFIGQHLFTSYLCPIISKKQVKWNRDARSVRCCSGPPSTPWCSKLIKKPHECHQSIGTRW